MTYSQDGHRIEPDCNHQFIGGVCIVCSEKDWLVEIIHSKREHDSSLEFEETLAKAIRKELLSRLPEELEHSVTCLYVREPRYFNNPSKEKYCSCGSYDVNDTIKQVREVIE